MLFPPFFINPALHVSSAALGVLQSYFQVLLQDQEEKEAATFFRTHLVTVQ